IVNTMIGFLGGGAATAWGFYLGSSAGSKNKDAMMMGKKL
ncbi:hypothetical protein LCGC14_3110100, partial [marine sediment metagenome]